MLTKIMLTQEAVVSWAKTIQQENAWDPCKAEYLSNLYYDTLDPAEKKYNTRIPIFNHQNQFVGRALRALVRKAGLLHHGTFVLVMHGDFVHIQRRAAGISSGNRLCYTGGGAFETYTIPQEISYNEKLDGIKELGEECFSTHEMTSWLNAWMGKLFKIRNFHTPRPDALGFYNCINSIFLLSLSSRDQGIWEKNLNPNPQEVSEVISYRLKDIPDLLQTELISQEFRPCLEWFISNYMNILAYHAKDNSFNS